MSEVVQNKLNWMATSAARRLSFAGVCVSHDGKSCTAFSQAARSQSSRSVIDIEATPNDLAMLDQEYGEDALRLLLVERVLAVISPEGIGIL